MPTMPPSSHVPSDPITIIATLHGNLVHLGRENAAKSVAGYGAKYDPMRHPDNQPITQDTVEDFIALHEDSFADLFGMEIYHELKRKLNRLSVRNGEAWARVRLRVELEE